MSDASPNRELGVQPLDSVLERLEISNQDLVAISTDQLTHKQVQKARKGRRVTRNIQKKIKNALEAALNERDESMQFALSDLFNYHH